MKPLQGLVAAVALAAVAACFYLIFEAGDRIYVSIGPSKAVAAADGTLYVASHGFIHIFGADGKRRARFDLGNAGVTRTPSDFAVHRDGRLVIANPDGSDLSRCTVAPSRCEPLDPKLTRVRLQKALPLNSVKVAIDEERARYYLSDNAGHRVVAVRFDGSRIAETQRFTVHYPNQLAIHGHELDVVDTNHGRVAAFDISGDTLGVMKPGMRLNAADVARRGRKWPFDAVRMPSGETWALLGDDLMKDADLVVFDAAGRAQKRIDLGEDSDPFDIEPWRGRVLVADATRYRIDAVSAEGKLEPAGLDPEFMAEMERASDEPAQWRLIRRAAQIGIGAVPLLAILILWRMGVPMSRGPQAPSPASGAPVPLTAAPQWIAMRPEYFAEAAARSRRVLLPVALMLIAATAALFFAFRDVIAGDLKLLRGLGLVIAVVVLHLLLDPFSRWISSRMFKRYRIGASSLGLHYETAGLMAPLAGPSTVRTPWRDVHFDGRMLLAGRRTLPVRSLGIWMFDPDRVARLIVANIPRANLVTTRQLFARQAGPLPWILLAIALALLVPILFLL